MDNELLQVVSAQGDTIGSIEKLAAHQNGGTWHRAISVFLFNSRGELLIQRRALTKYHFAGKWANSCCSHPWPGESSSSAASRTVLRELGIDPILEELGVFRYEATDLLTGLSEREWDHVFVGNWDSTVRPAPQEVCEVRWIPVEHLRHEISENPTSFAPWLGLILTGFEELSAVGQRRSGIDQRTD